MAKVVYLDDEEFLTSIFKESLEDEGEVVETFNCPDRAGSFLKENAKEVKCLFVDYHMPSMDGITFAKQYHGLFPIVLVTGEVDLSQVEDVKLFDHIITKPYDEDTILELVGAMSP